MPRGHKYDRFETERAYREGRLTDKRKRSFIGRDSSGQHHELLAGEDKSRRYREIMDAAKGLCQGCSTPHYVGSMGEWDHIKSGLSGRCDCLHNGRWVCVDFHRKRHVHVKWSEA
jgi:hypothetical protein